MSKTILIWDIENISIKHIETIFNNLIYKPDMLYAISKQNINEKTLELLKEKNIKYIKSNRIADEMILDFLNITLETKNNYILISSDSDFCVFTKLATEKGKNIQWFLQDAQKKRILMKNDITLPNIKYFLLDNIKKEKKHNQIKRTNKIRNSVKGITSKLSLNYLENLIEFKKEKTLPEKNKKKELLNKRLLWIENTIKGIIERRINRRKDDYCNYCGGFSKIRNDNSLFCLECEQKFVKKYKNIQELSHEEKLKAFYLDTEKEIRETGNVVYSQEILDLDLLELELQKTINVPNKYKLENIK